MSMSWQVPLRRWSCQGRGKEADQGVGYLDDGTMIVVEHGKDAVGKKVETMVTSVIQTNAGRMIFVKMI